jgi:hypothetical protein
MTLKKQNEWRNETVVAEGVHHLGAFLLLSDEPMST